MTKVVLEVKNLTKIFPGSWSFKKLKRGLATLAVDNISFSIREGEIVGLLGPNGAGKTTTIQMLLGTTSKTKGQVSYFGKVFEKHRSEIMQQINYASAHIRLPWRLTVGENLMVYATMYQVAKPKERISQVLDFFKMSQSTNKGFSTLSSGQMTRVILAKAMINFPKLLLLDEPTASLDPEVADKVRKFLAKQQEKYNVSMLFTSHNMAEVAELCDRVIFLRKGKIVAEDTPEGLARTIKTCTLRLWVGDDWERLKVFSQGRGYQFKIDGPTAEIKIKESEIAPFLNNLAKQEIKYREISIDKPTLEDFFLAQTYE